MEHDAGDIVRALRTIGASPAARALLVASLRDVEPLLAREGVNVREEITGPLVDVLHHGVSSVDVVLENGLAFSALYTGKIARDLAMREHDRPNHVFEPQTTKTLLRLARGAHHVVIGGAYSGDHAILLAHALRGAGVVHAFEPNPRQLGALRANAARNGIDNIRPVPLGLWNDESTTLGFVGSDELAATRPSEDGAIAVTTIDAYVRREQLDRVDLIMLDIEGSELAALEGARDVLGGTHAPNVVFEIHGSYVDWSAGLLATPVARLLTDRGYRLFAIRDYQSHVDAMSDAPVELVPPETAHLAGPPHGFNMLATKDLALLDDPLFRVVPDVSPKLLHHRDQALHAPRHRAPV